MVLHPLLLATPLLITSLTWGAAYYLDSRIGSDSNNGTAPENAWKTLTKIRAQAFKPGDTLNIQAGSEFTDGLTLDDSGIEGKPVVIRARGEGAKPHFSGRGLQISGDWMVFEGMRITGVRNEGIRINAGAIHNVVRGCEISECGAGLWVSGTDNLVTGNHIHDLKIVVNTVGGDDDNGAVGIWMAASRVEISYNRFVNCKAPSYDYKYDGGAVEWWAEAALDGCYVHHNFATGCEGFMESGGRGATISNARVSYNVAVDNGWFALLNTQGQYAVVLENFQVDHNTVIQTGPHIGWGATKSINFFDPAPKSVTLRNNVFHLAGWNVCDNATIAHKNNLFYFTGGKGAPGFTLDATDKIANPQFMDLAGGNYQLLPGSPAIDMGMKLAQTVDFLGRPALVGGLPDAGAFEFQGGISSTSRRRGFVSGGEGGMRFDVAGRKFRGADKRMPGPWVIYNQASGADGHPD